MVDEGPGRSGSTFLAVAEALERHGVPASRIRLLASHPIDTERLAAADAPRRFARFRVDAVDPWSAPEGSIDLSGGAWRDHVELRSWPACWRAHERVKYLEPGRRRLHKFSGLSRYGANVLERASLLADAGFAPNVAPANPGFLAYAWLPHRAADGAGDARRAVDALARYLAFRATEFGGAEPQRDELESMKRLNLVEGTGERLPERFELQVVQPVVCDGRMLPHEWLVDGDGGFVKTDGAEHGDDHFYPGPVDVAWDIAGAVVEWNLGDALEDALVTRYRELAREDVRPRLVSYKLAYSAFRLGVADFAAEDARHEDERARWRRLRRRYALHATRALGSLTTRA